MRKSLLFVIIMLNCLCANAQEENDTLVSLAKVNFEGLAELPLWSSFTDGETDATIEIVDDGIAITNPQVQDQSWQPQMTVIGDNLILEDGHDYIVRLTLKVPSDGYWMFFGSWDVRLVCEVPVTANDDFQIIDIDFSSFVGNTWRDGFVVLGNGWVAGTTVLKKVQVYERRKGGETAMKTVKTVKDNDAIYSLAGQKVGTSYKGIVIQNGKKIIVK